jgi:outer membrane biogenesis lipoprotein LolB
MNIDNEINDYGLGWAFFNTYGVKGGCFLPLETDNLVEWIKGFMAAQADYDLPQEYRSVEAALIDNGAEGVLLVKLLEAADTALLPSDEWLRLPSVPVRGRAKLSVVSA